MIDGTVDVFVGVLESGSKAVKTVALDVDINVSVFVAAGNSCNQCWRDRLCLLVRRECEYNRLGIVFIRSLLTVFFTKPAVWSFCT